MTISFEKALGIHVDALALRARRTELLAANIANADTPNYKARDIDFRTVLKEQVAGGGVGQRLATTQQHHIGTPGAGAGQFDTALQYRVPHQPSVDGNTVESQVEQAEFARNALQYQASLHFLSNRFKGLVSAIRGE